MSQENKTDLGEEIFQKVNDAIERVDWNALDEKISHTMDRAREESRRAWEYGNRVLREQWDKSVQASKESRQKKTQQCRNQTADTRKQIVVPFRVKGNTSGMVMQAFGWMGAFLFGIPECVFLALYFVEGGAVFFWLLLFFGMACLGSGWLLLSGAKRVKRCRRSKRYWNYLREKGYCSIESIAARMGLPEKKIRQDIKDMLEDEIFPQAALDDTETCLIGNQEYYILYEQAKRSLEQSREQEHAPVQTEPEARWLAEIKEMQKKVREPEFQADVERLQRVSEQIYQYLDEHPEKKETNTKFLDYYMPTTVKLLQTYIQLDSQTIQGENIQGTKEEIRETVRTINGAFEKMLDEFYEDVNLDISTDISVLNTMLEREGWKESKFK